MMSASASRSTPWQRVARRPILAVSLIAGVRLVCILLITSGTGIPEARYHDESATLVMADIFAHGHVCEPPHPFWQHFETFHVLSQPCYQGKYPPGPALLMALGQVVTGYPIAGVWLSVVLAIAAIGYAMYAWLPAEWALLATALAALRFGIVGQWPHSYWGGSLAAAGGALVLGAARRITTTPAAVDGALLGVGLVALAMSRPYEGAAYAAVPLALVIWSAVRPWPERARLRRAAIPAAAAVLLVAGGWLAFYDRRVTGSATTPAYVAYERQYSAAPLFVVQKPRVPPPVLRHREMQRFEQDFALHNALIAQNHWPWLGMLMLAGIVWKAFQPTLGIAAMGVLLTDKLRRAGVAPAVVPVALLSLAAIFAACSLQLWWAPRYLDADDGLGCSPCRGRRCSTVPVEGRRARRLAARGARNRDNRCRGRSRRMARDSGGARLDGLVDGQARRSGTAPPDRW